MGKLGKLSLAGKNHGPCDSCGLDIEEKQYYRTVYRNATEEEKNGRTWQRKRTYVVGGQIKVMVKVHDKPCSIGYRANDTRRNHGNRT